MLEQYRLVQLMLLKVNDVAYLFHFIQQVKELEITDEYTMAFDLYPKSIVIRRNK